MLEEKDIIFINELIKDRIKEYKNKISGIKHFLEYKIRIGQPEFVLDTDRKEIEELKNKIHYANNLLEKLKGI